MSIIILTGTGNVLVGRTSSLLSVPIVISHFSGFSEQAISGLNDCKQLLQECVHAS